MQIPKTIKIDRNKRHYIEWHQSVTNDYFNTIYNIMEDGMFNMVMLAITAVASNG